MIKDKVKDKLPLIMEDSRIDEIFSLKEYVDPRNWMREHIQTHTEFLESAGETAQILPFTFKLSSNSIGCIGVCMCNVCGETFSMTDIDNW